MHNKNTHTGSLCITFDKTLPRWANDVPTAVTNGTLRTLAINFCHLEQTPKDFVIHVQGQAFSWQKDRTQMITTRGERTSILWQKN